MLTLYVKTGCPYCARVLEVVKILGVSIEEKNIKNPAIAEELIRRGGKRQVPYLVDSERGVEMYESEDIAEYLCREYGKGDTVPVPEALENVCPADHDDNSASK